MPKRDVVVAFRISNETAAKLRRSARADDRRLSAFLRRVVERALAE